MDKLKVNCYSGHTYAERPESFLWQGIEYKRVPKTGETGGIGWRFIYGKPSKPLQNQIEVDLFLYPAIRDVIEKLNKENLEHHFRLIGRPAKIRGISIPAELIDEGEINRFIQELEEVCLWYHSVIDMAAVEGKLA